MLILLLIPVRYPWNGVVEVDPLRLQGPPQRDRPVTQLGLICRPQLKDRTVECWTIPRRDIFARIHSTRAFCEEFANDATAIMPR